MKVSITVTALALAAAIIGCQSEEEKIKQAQVENCKELARQGKEITDWCLSRVPELAQLAQVRRPPEPQAPSAPQYVEQAPVQYAPQAQPVIVNQQPQQQNSGMSDMLLGGLIGHAIGSSGSSNAAPAPSYNRDYYPSRPRVVTQNITIKDAPKQVVAPVVPAAPKKNYMDTSKLTSYGARPSAPVKSSGMNMGALSKAGKR